MSDAEKQSVARLTEDIRKHVGPVSKSDNLRLAETIYGKGSKQAQEAAKVKRCEYSHQWQRIETEPSTYVCDVCGYTPRVDSKLYHEAESILHLRSVLNPGDTVYTVLRHVSRSGMSRNIDLYYMAKDNGVCSPQWISAYVGHAIGSPQSMKNWKASQGLTVGGCGMDMGFYIVESLSRAIYPTYQCLGKGNRCPSSYHVNHRDMVQCRGVSRYRVYCLDEGDRMAATTQEFETREAAEVYAATISPSRKPEVENDSIPCFRSDTLRLPDIEIAGERIPQGKAYTIHPENGEEYVCPTCKGHGRIPNPDGPERWDLVHTDGYALNHKWL